MTIIHIEIDVDLREGDEQPVEKIGSELTDMFSGDVYVNNSRYEIGGAVDITEWVDTLYRRWQDTGGTK